MNASVLFLSILALSALSARADEIDFYKFRTGHSMNAQSSVTFRVRTLQTNLSDSDVNRSYDVTCWVASEATTFTCANLDGDLSVDVASAQKIIEGYFAPVGTIVTAEKRSEGVFQFRYSNDEVYHVVINVPVVGDDSMECQIAAVFDKKFANVTCHSQFTTDHTFTVRDLPIDDKTSDKNWLVLGLNGGPGNDSETQVAAKVSELAANIAKFKHTSVDSANIYNIAFPINPDAAKTKKIFINRYYSDQLSTVFRGVAIDGSVTHIHRGLNGQTVERSGD